MIPWIYHRLTPRDQAGDLLRVVNFTQERTGANTVITYEVPQEKLLLVSHAHFYWTDGVNIGHLFALTQNTTTILNEPAAGENSRTVAGLALQSNHRSGAPWLMAPPGSVLNSILLGGFAGSAHIFSFNGILIPHGTFSE